MSRSLTTNTLLIVFGFLTGCQNKPVDHRTSDAAVYFDLKKYAESEIDRLNKTQAAVLKTVSVNGKEEQQTLQQLDYRAELAVLLDADINRPAWKGKYRVDSSYVAPDQWAITYTATDEKPPVRTLSVGYLNQEVASITIERAAKTLVAGSNQHLSYSPASGFEMETEQKVLLMPARHIRIALAFPQRQ